MTQNSTKPPSQLKGALLDISEGLSRLPLVRVLATEALRHRYRRTAFGLLWSGVSFLLFLAIYVLVFGYIRDFRGQALIDYALHVGYGWVVWGFLSGVVTSGVVGFANSTNWISGSNNPLSLYVLRDVVEQLYVGVTAFVIMIILTLIIGHSYSMVALYAIIGIIACIFNAFWVAMFLATLAVRFRDLQHLLTSLMRAFFFTTPILWTYDQGEGVRTGLAIMNPFTHFIESIRLPLTGAMPTTLNWTVIGVTSIVMPIIALALFSSWRRRIALWV